MAVQTGRGTFTIVAGPEFVMVANMLREVDAKLPGELRKKLKESVKPAVNDAKNTVRNMPTLGHAGHTGLRRRVALGVNTLAGTSNTAYIRVVTTMAADNEAIIPRGLDRPGVGWRHPVFGHRNTWVQQHPLGDGWFRRVLYNHRDDIENGLVNTLQWAADTIAAAGGAPHPGA